MSTHFSWASPDALSHMALPVLMYYIDALTHTPEMVRSKIDRAFEHGTPMGPGEVAAMLKRQRETKK